MIARTAQEFFGFDFTANREWVVIAAVLLVFVGLFLAFAGRRIWKNVMSFIGGFIGVLVGFALGVAISSVLVGFLVGVLGGIIGSAIFVFLARVGISALGGVLAFLLASVLGGDSVFMFALIAGVVVFIAIFVFVEAAIGVVTAVAGGLLFGFGLILLEVDMTLSLIAMLAVIVFGAALQLYAWHEEEEVKHGRVPVRSASAGAAVAPPVPPEVPVRACRKCAKQLRYVPEYNRYYCDACQEYE